MDFSEQIQAGMEWLDENRPGWDAEIHLPDLDMGNADECVLGQTGGYWDAIYDHSYEWSVDKGFMVSDMDYFGDDGGYRLYDDLTSQWKDAIQARQDTYDGINQATSN